MTTNDPLFGSGIRLTGPWASREFASVEVSFREAVRTLPGLVWFALSLAWRADRWALLATALSQLVQATMSAFGLLAVNQVLIGLLTEGPNSSRIRAAMPALIAFALIAIVGSVARAISTAATGRLSPKVLRLAEQRLLERTVSVELAILEDGAFHRSLAGARLGVSAMGQLITGVLGVIGSLVTLSAVVGVMGMVHPLLIPLLLLAVVPQAWKAVTVARWQYASTKRWLDQSRQKRVLADVLMERGAPAEEIRVHGLGGYLLSHYRRLSAALESEQTRLARSKANIGMLADGLGGLTRLVTYVVLGWLLIIGVVALAAAGTAVIAITRVTGQLTGLLLQLNELYSQGLFVGDYTSVLRTAGIESIPHGGVRPATAPRRISVRDVTFAYPGSEQLVLRGVDLELRRGEVIALVGANGSGKTTLAKLLAGLHHPQRGEITWDGVSLRDLDRADVFSHVAWIGQDFQRWPFTARLNATLGRPEAVDEEIRLMRAAGFAGADEVISALPQQWNTLLAREFHGGVNLSGGQWQRLALARAHFRGGQILVCDEPTAALDPISEIAAFEKLMALADEQTTVVLVTHRLGSVRYADRIYVLVDGRIEEAGTHEELMAIDGVFALMYRAQLNQYAITGAELPDRVLTGQA